MKARSYNIKEKLAGSKRVATACMRALRQRAMIRSVLNTSQSGGGGGGELNTKLSVKGGLGLGLFRQPLGRFR